MGKRNILARLRGISQFTLDDNPNSAILAAKLLL